MSPDIIPWLAALFFILGLSGLVLEIFLVPGFGIAGTAGLLLLGWSVMLLVVDVTQATQALVIALAVTAVLFFLGVKGAAKLNLWHRISLRSRQYKEAGYMAPKPELIGYLGKTGTVITSLRPAGTVEVERSRLDVVSQGEYIPKGTRVSVISVEGSRVVVKRIEGR